MKNYLKSNFLSGFFGVLLGCVLTITVVIPQVENKIGMNQNQVAQEVQIDAHNTSSVNIENPVTAIVKDTMNSVVGITSEFTVEQQNPMRGFGGIDDFFGGLFPDLNSPSIRSKVSAIGTGVIVSKNGYVLTNAHVVNSGENSTSQAILNNGKKVDLKFIWADTALDLALLQLPKGTYQPAKLGDSSKVQVGDTAIAIGNPLGLNFSKTVTKGIISGIDRTVSSEETGDQSNLIQTDASINQGNSGGPLLNSKGEVIGINTIKVSGEGLGFAIPINTAKVFIDILETNGQIQDKPILGIVGISAEHFNSVAQDKVKTQKGVVVRQISKQYPAYKAGIRPGDVIVKVNDTEVNNMSDLITSMYKYGQDLSEPINITVNENGKEKTVQVNLKPTSPNLKNI